jgi:DNA polymerase-3 subunit delta
MAITYEGVLKEIATKKLRPVYYLMGEEAYYIDRLTERFANDILNETEQEFNQTIIYGQDTSMRDVLLLAKRYPMMADRQVVIVKEAQNLKNDIDELSFYLQRPQPSTVLVFCHKNGSLDRRKKTVADIERAGGAVYESKKIKDDKVPDFIVRAVTKKGYTIEERAVKMLTEFVGNDLIRVMSELDKLYVNMTEGEKHVTADMVEEFTGISKDYNVFELQTALARKDVLRANRIVKYMESNPKTFPMQAVLPLLFKFFADVMMAYYAKPRTLDGVKVILDRSSTWGLQEHMMAMRNYSAFKVMDIISELRRYDGMSKGVGATSNMTDGLLMELVYYILH